jgi:hypothetical protein
MGQRFHYNRKGEYTGMSTDEPLRTSSGFTEFLGGVVACWIVGWILASIIGGPVLTWMIGLFIILKWKS